MSEDGDLVPLVLVVLVVPLGRADSTESITPGQPRPDESSRDFQLFVMSDDDIKVMVASLFKMLKCGVAMLIETRDLSQVETNGFEEESVPPAMVHDM